MKNTLGNRLTVTLFGESHGPLVGAVVDGLTPGMTVDTDRISDMLAKRRPSGQISTARAEKDEFVIQSGVFEGKTTGSPLCILIPNTDTRSKDYGKTKDLARPSHADYTANCKYHGYEDYRGGGHFSGRITAALVAVGGILMPTLEAMGIRIGTHIKSCAGISDRAFADYEKDIALLSTLEFATLDENAGEEMKKKILEAKSEGDSVGGTLETVITGLEAGLGEPWFDTVEGMLSHALFSIPAVKGVEFGAGFSLSSMRGSLANDPFAVECGRVITKTNNSGGINGGITNGMPVTFSTAIRPTPTIIKEQDTIDMTKKENAKISPVGRHDPCIVHRARIVVDSVAAIVVADLLAERYGDDWAKVGGR